MEPSPLETSSEQETATYPVAYVNSIEVNLNWHAALLAVLLQEAGGVVEIREDDLKRINLETAKAAISFDEERKVYIVEGLHEDES